MASKRYRVVAELSGYDRSRDERVLDELDKLDRRLLEPASYDVANRIRGIWFSTAREEIAHRLERNLKCALRQSGETGTVRVYPPDSVKVKSSEK